MCLPKKELDIFMTHGTVNVKLRPIKLGFLVNPKDKDSLLKAIEINTFLWGGMYNPIIPTYRRIPQKWEYGPENLNTQSIISGYLDNFDPDYVIPMGECSGYPLDVGNREKIEDASEILASVEREGTPKYGIGLFEVLNYFYEEELKFQRRYPLDICVPRLGTRFHCFLSSVFGIFSENIDQIFWERFAEALEAKKIDCSPSNYTQFFHHQKLFLRRITHLYLESSDRREQCIFFLDATNPLDIMDYWNLRAIGWHVIPVPKQFTKLKKTKQFIRNFIEANHVPHHSNPEIYHRTTILRGRSISEDEHQHFCDSYDISISDETHQRAKVTRQFWYPPMWDEWARENRADCCEIEADTAEHDISTNQEMIRFKTLDPKFISRFGGYGEPRFVNEIKLRLYDDKELFAEVIPEGGYELARVIGEFDFLNWRLSRKGLVYLSRYSRSTVSLSLPLAEPIFTKWLESRGWEVKLSSAGRIAKQMIRQLGGVNGTWILAHKGIIQLLGEMSSSNVILSKLINQISNLEKLLKQDQFQTVTDKLEVFVKDLEETQSQLGGHEKSMSEESVRSRIAQIANQAQYGIEADRLLQRLIDAKVIQLGMEIQCSECTRSSWYSVKDADYELQCPECLGRIVFPPTSKAVKWSYRPLGPFSSPNQTHGAYAVLLTLRFFSKLVMLGGATTPLMSFTAKKGQADMEADLALFFQASKFGDSKTEVIFAECKTFNDFEKKKDVDKMVDLGDAFPGAILVFATLKKSLKQKEETLLRRVVNRSRTRRKNNRPFNPVLILTGKELFLQSYWQSHLEESGPARDLVELCDLTQQLNLGIDSWHQWLDRELGRTTTPVAATWTTRRGDSL